MDTPFINTCSRCFVESIEVYGRSVGRNDYFWKEAQDKYPDLHSALRRIKLYRNEQDHLELNNKVNADFLDLLQNDFESKPFSQIYDPYFVLQQRVLDNLLLGIQVEIDKIS